MRCCSGGSACARSGEKRDRLAADTRGRTKTKEEGEKVRRAEMLEQRAWSKEQEDKKN